MEAFIEYLDKIVRFYNTRHRLMDCAKYFGHAYSPHDSEADAIVTLECFNSIIANEEFVTYVPRKKKSTAEIERDPSGALPQKSQKPASFTVRKTLSKIKISISKRRGPFYWGILLALMAECMIYLNEKQFMISADKYIKVIITITSLWKTDQYLTIGYLLLGIACLLLLFGVVKFVLSLPRIITAKFKHVKNRFD